MLVQLHHIIKSGLISAVPLTLVISRLVEQVFTSLFVGHSLIEVVLETLENCVLCLLVAFEVIAVLEPQHGILFVAT